MVNIGGRSKACSTCRKRRVKCDESRPVCRRCQSLDLECDGPRDITFIYEKPAGPRTVQKRTVLPEDHAVLLSASPRITGFDVYICYTQSHLIRDGLIASAIADIRAVDLVPSGTAVASRQVSHQAIMSFATLLFGIQHRQADIAGQGYAMYGVALKQLNQVLSDATRHTRVEVIVSVAALAISESLVPTGPNNYLTHMVGLERLVSLQDPASFWSGRSSGFCKGVRFLILFASLQLRKPSILARSDWKKAMRAESSYEQLQEQDLFDVLADCTVLLAKRDAVLSAWDADAIKAREQQDKIQQRACCLLTHLNEWRLRWDADPKNASYDTSASPSGSKESQFACNGDPDRSLVTVATIATVPAAVMLMLYNLALMHVLQVLAPLPPPHKESAPRNASHQPETARRYHVDERIAARETCRCIQYYMSIRRRLDASASPIVHWAVAAAWARLRRDDSVEGAWMRDLLTSIGRQVVAEGLWTTYKWLNSLPE
ncbi:hypothetical protein BCR34DRAFT_571136 [Clohesyomyces aquaticus]|uniref:Zn(2)-C6 fungal-type domain-containing protein n=1 Tax=Clohesyomyces aquaticus TaxID=1231657 RepID=A0A1Y1Z937_9PLEO|nr:hypothetical protein BCR34DRAFT_571136 [Clohesyomyces aquaticus]